MLEEIILPVGTIVTQSQDDKSSFDFELPGKYQFVIFDGTEVAFSRKSSYTCTCSGEGATGSCTVFHHKKAGFGCLQNDCSDTCSGKASGGDKQRVVGFIDTSIDEITTIKADYQSASLSQEGIDLFFERIAKDKINEQYELIYSEYETTEDLINSGEKTVLVSVNYLGVPFSLIVPNFDDLKENQLFDFKSGTTVTCSGSNGCTCEKKQKCILRNCVYYCNGCKSCTMEVEEE